MLVYSNCFIKAQHALCQKTTQSCSIIPEHHSLLGLLLDFLLVIYIVLFVCTCVCVCVCVCVCIRDGQNDYFPGISSFSSTITICSFDSFFLIRSLSQMVCYLIWQGIRNDGINVNRHACSLLLSKVLAK